MRPFSRGEDHAEPERADDVFQARLWGILAGLLLLALYVIGFIVQNDDQVSVDFVFASTNVSLIWVILLSLALGVLGGVLLSQLYRRRRGQTP
jgi:uncharacterized integral membrane protein